MDPSPFYLGNIPKKIPFLSASLINDSELSFFFYNEWPKFYDVDELVNLAIVTSSSSESMTINFFEYSSSGRQAGVQWPMHHNSSQEPLLPPSPLLPSPLPPLCHHHNNHQHQYNQPPIFIIASFPLILLLLFLCSRIFWRKKVILLLLFQFFPPLQTTVLSCRPF